MFDKLRMIEWALVALALLLILWITAPAQIPVVAYKVQLVTFFAFLGYWIDRRLFPYARPDRIECHEEYTVSFAMCRRAIIVAAVVVAGALAL